ncbi:MAG: hypothetical protein IJ233_01380, partial [Pyramidobacter sp.]|nr:hypothetical protein [Pyramidobacter sp.]
MIRPFSASNRGHLNSSFSPLQTCAQGRKHSLYKHYIIAWFNFQRQATPEFQTFAEFWASLKPGQTGAGTDEQVFDHHP